MSIKATLSRTGQAFAPAIRRLKGLFGPARLGAATPENPRFNLNDPAAWDGLTDGEPASSGMRVTRESALTYSPWWRGLQLISSDVAKLPLLVVRIQGEGKIRDMKHQAYAPLRRRPNDYQTAHTFKKQLTTHALHCGNGYAYIYRRGDGSLLPLVDGGGICPLDPDCTYPVRANGQLWYITEIGGEQRKLAPEDVLHIKGLSFDGLVGYEVYKKARESLGLGLGALKYGSVFFRNNARPNLAIEFPGVIDEKSAKAVVASWERMQGGLDKQHRVALLRSGMKLQTFGSTARESQLLELRQFQIREIAGFLGVPPHKLGDTSRTAYSSLEQENQSYLDECLDHWLTAWEDECWEKLLTEEEKDQESHAIEFAREALMRANLADRANYYRVALGGRPWMTQNEVRGRENLNPATDADANQILEPLNMGQGGADNEPAKPAKPAKPVKQDQPADPADEADGKARQAQRILIADAAGRMVRRIGVHARRAAKRPAEFLSWIDAIASEHGEVVRGAFDAPASACAVLGGPPAKADAVADLLVSRLHGALLHLAGQATTANLDQLVDRYMADAEQTLPTAFAAELFPGDSDDV